MNLYNNLKTKVYLGLILGLVLIPGPVLSETWEANLDLTIPSLEMPSTLVLDSKDKQGIMMGFECCWDQKHIEAVKKEHSQKSIESLLRANQKRSQYTLHSDDTKHQWATFYIIHILDIHSTLKGMKYSCIYESNPILPRVPHRDHLILHKSLLMATIFNRKYFDWGKIELDALTIGTSLAVIKNHQIINNATCPKRG